MLGKTNAGGAGGGGGAKAALSVTYPSGSSCVCSDGIRTLKAIGTDGKNLFLLPAAGSWTVTAEDRSINKMATKTIDLQEEDAKTIAIMFSTPIAHAASNFKAVKYAWVSGAELFLTTEDLAEGTMLRTSGGGQSGYAMTTQSYDCQQYTKVVCEWSFQQVSIGGYPVYIPADNADLCLFSSDSATAGTVLASAHLAPEIVKTDQSGVATLNIPANTVNAFVGFRLKTANAANIRFVITDLYFE